MPVPYTNSMDEREIRELIQDRVDAVRSKDVDRAAANVGQGVVSFDVIGPLRYSGSDALKRRAEEWFASFEGPIGFEVRDLNIVAGGDVAFSYSLNHVSATTRDGKQLKMWWRSTVGYRKIGGRWMVAHEHKSVPFDPSTGNASLDLQP